MRSKVIGIAVVSTLLFGGALGSLILPGTEGGSPGLAGTPDALADSPAKHLPIYITENRGQSDSRAKYYFQSSDASVFFTRRGLALSLADRRRSGRTWGLRLNFVGARRGARPSGVGRTPAVVSDFRGRRSEWRTRIPTFSGVTYREVWPGVDVVYSGRSGRLKYSFVVKPGADPGSIRLRWRGATGVALNRRGQLAVSTPARRLVDDAPVSFQRVGGRRSAVDSAFAVGQGHTYGFRVGGYDRSRPLVIDPAMLVNAGYIGGAKDDMANNVALDRRGNLFVTGGTGSSDFPAKVGPDRSFNGGLEDVFVAKVRPDGSGLKWVSYLGGSQRETGIGMAVDRAGNAYVSGSTSSADFPTRGGPDLTYNGGQQDGFVAKITADGSRLAYSGFVGGSTMTPSFIPNNEQANGLAVDAAGSAYLAGFTPSSAADGFPVTPGSLDTTHNGFIDTFVAKVRPNGSGLVYAGYIGGAGADPGTGLAVDARGNAYVNGFTGSDQSSFPDGDGFGSVPGFDRAFNGPPGPAPGDAFVAKVNPSGSALAYATYIGGSGGEQPFGNAVDRKGNVYLTGYTTSTQKTFPVRRGPDLTYNGGSSAAPPGGDAFVAKLNPLGTRLLYAGYIGGSRDETAVGIDIQGGHAYVAGSTTSRNFPARNGPDRTYNGGREDAFLAKVKRDGSGLSYAGYVGGSLRDGAIGLAVDDSGDAWLSGSTESRQRSFPAVVGPDLTFNGPFGDSDAFVARVSTRTCFGRPVTRLGTPGNDRIRGTRRPDVIAGLGGSDAIAGLGGADRICGGRGRDTLSGASGNDQLDGGGARDRCAGGGGRDRARRCERTTSVP